MSTHNLCFKKKYEKYRCFLSENFQFLEVKFSIYLNRRVFIMRKDFRFDLFVLRFYGPVNPLGSSRVSLPNHTFSWVGFVL